MLATVEGSREQIERCFTLEVATDTILFCSSIAHDIPFRAATMHSKGREFTESKSNNFAAAGEMAPAWTAWSTLSLLLFSLLE